MIFTLSSTSSISCSAPITRLSITAAGHAIFSADVTPPSSTVPLDIPLDYRSVFRFDLQLDHLQYELDLFSLPLYMKLPVDGSYLALKLDDSDGWLVLSDQHPMQGPISGTRRSLSLANMCDHARELGLLVDRLKVHTATVQLIKSRTEALLNSKYREDVLRRDALRMRVEQLKLKVHSQKDISPPVHLPCDERTEPSDDISEVIVSSTSDDEPALEKVKHAVRLHKSALVEELLSEVYILENHGQGVRSIRGLALPNVNLLKKDTLSLIASMGLKGVSSDEIEYNIWQALW
jgi:hypothetical protein